MIGEYERAFYGNQYALMAPLFEHYGIGLWMPEVGGRVDWLARPQPGHFGVRGRAAVRGRRGCARVACCRFRGLVAC